jgi:zinc protease
LTRELVELGVAGMDETQIASRMADVGAQLSGEVDRDRASIALRTLSMADKRAVALELLRAILSTPQFPGSRFRAREGTFRGGAQGSADASRDARQKGVVVGHVRFASLRTTGDTGVGGGLERADVLAFHAAHYTAPRATLAIVGDLSRAQAEAVAEELTAALPASPGMTAIAVPELPSSGEQRIAHPAVQAHLLLGLPALKRGDPDFFPLIVGNYTLGGGALSRA